MRQDADGRWNITDSPESLGSTPSGSWPQLLGIRRSTALGAEGCVALRVHCGLYAIPASAGMLVEVDEILEWVVLTPVASKDFMDLSRAVRSVRDVFDQKTLERVPDTVLGRAAALVDGVLRGWFRRESK